MKIFTCSLAASTAVDNENDLRKKKTTVKMKKS